MNQRMTKQWRYLRHTAAALCLGVAFAAAVPAISAAAAPISEARNSYVVRAAQAIGPAVVGISSKAYARDFFNQKVLVEQGCGSGVIFDARGYIATNNHVVEGAQELAVSLADGRVLNAKVVGTDPATDLAVVKVEAANLPVAVFGNSDELLVGEPAIAIGNPLGMEFKGSVTVGVISALNRSLEIGERKFKLIQTDAAINPGNSGGALVNADGQLIGINSAKIAASGVEGIGFAIPVNLARPILQTLIEKGHIPRSYFGVSALDKELAAAYGYYLDIDKGVYVVRLQQDGPAYKAGIRQRDIILRIGSHDVNSVADLRSLVETYAIGATVNVTVQRGDRTLTLPVRLEEMPRREAP